MTRSNGSISAGERIISGKHKGTTKYILQIELPPDPLTGARHRKTKTVYCENGRGKRPDKAVKEKLTDFIKENENGLSIDADKITFAEYAHKWLKAQETRGLSERTMIDNKCTVNVLCSTAFASMKLKDIKPETLETLYAQLKEERGIGNTRLLKYHVKVKQILRHAVVNKNLTSNPADLVDAPTRDTPTRRALTRDEAYRLLRCVENAEAAEYEALQGRAERENHWCDENGISRDNGRPRTSIRGIHHLANLTAVRLMLNNALRLSECMGLLWDSVDTAKGTLTICRSLTKTGHLKDTKTHRDRTIMLDGNTRMALIRWRNIQRETLARLGIEQTDETPVICSDTGGYGIGNFERWWRLWRAANDFDDLRCHELRHTCISLLVAAGVDLKTVQSIGGWSSPQVLLNVYAHAYEESKRAAAEKLGALLNEPPEQSEPPKLDVIKSA